MRTFGAILAAATEFYVWLFRITLWLTVGIFNWFFGSSTAQHDDGFEQHTAPTPHARQASAPSNQPAPMVAQPPPVQVTVINNIGGYPTPPHASQQAAPQQPRVQRQDANPLERKICITTGSQMLILHPYEAELEEGIRYIGVKRMEHAFENYQPQPQPQIQPEWNLPPLAEDEPPLPATSVIAMPAEDDAIWIATTAAIAKSRFAHPNPRPVNPR